MNENGHYRGLHIVIINASNGLVELSQVFDTYKSYRKFDTFTSNDIPSGYIIVAACRDECVKNLSKKGKDWFKKHGSKEIE